MRIYLDDDSVAGLLVRLLRQAGHDVLIPADAGLTGADDVIHMTRAAQEGRVLLSQNYRDFENLHNLVIEVGGHHPGILMVRRDNDLECSPKSDPCVMRVSATNLVKEILDEETEATHAGADHSQAS